ncbi:hypothetical protein FOA52_012263 [Chlamydomonas sp. UWO 241]|nr:hypothetical protein FOA52_012263 [Chlamydomonas sp. UWO 241]
MTSSRRSPMSARGAGGGGGMSMTVGARPASAPRQRSMGATADAKARVEETRQVKEAQFWGRDVPAKRDLPAYWSVATYGQPFNDERLAMGGATNIYQLLEPTAAKPNPAMQQTGPASEHAALLRKSLTDGKRYFNKIDLSPLAEGTRPETLAPPDRVYLLTKLSPYQKIFALRNCLDRNVHATDFMPWTAMVDTSLDAKFWARNKELAIRIAVQKLENMMRRHLRYMSDQRSVAARAPASSSKGLLKEEFWRVDPDRTELIALEQFLQVWQTRLCLLEYDDKNVMSTTGKKLVKLVPGKRFILDENMAAALFVKYGFDKDGLMPYQVFCQTLCAAPARLLGQELVIDKKEQGKHGLSDESDIAYCMGGAKILYPKCETGVFPPSDFDSRMAERSRMLPRAHMWLEHVYGYAGKDIQSGNLFFTHNTTATESEYVYYTGAVGVVFNKELWGEGKPSQRFFFGHDNDIQCLAIHPGRRFVATGQQKQTGKSNCPYVCIWDIDTCNQLQKLEHEYDDRAVIAVGFSGNVQASTEEKRGGSLLITITADDKHTVRVWTWMTSEDKFCKAVAIPGWSFGPEKKLETLRSQKNYYDNPDKFDEDKLSKDTAGYSSKPKYELKSFATWPSPETIEVAAHSKEHPLLDRLNDPAVAIKADWEWGYCTECPPGKQDKTWTMIEAGNGCNGTPPMVYGIMYNPLRPSDGRKGSEFCTFGVKHLKTWIVNDQETWQGTSASFGSAHIENVLCACYVPALHYMAAPGDSCLLTGFTSGQLGLWIPPFPTRAGSTYQLTRKYDAHGPGSLVRLNDGTQVHGGVRAIRLRGDPSGKTTGRRIVTGGADGYVMQWELAEVTGTRKDGSAIKGVDLKCLSTADEHEGPNRFQLSNSISPYDPKNPPMVVSLDCHIDKPTEFVAGTAHCDIWEVDKDPRIVIEGHEDDMWRLATHPEKPNIFASTCLSGVVRVWDSTKFDVVCSCNLGFSITGITYSNEAYGCSTYGDPKRSAFHIAIGSKGGYALGDWHKIAIVDADTLQPLKILKDPCAQVAELKYSPASTGDGGMLAAGCNDMAIYVYSCKHDYQLVSKCVGHSGNVAHIDWTLPISMPGHRLHGSMIFKAVDQSGNMLFWDPKTGRKVSQNQRDAPYASMTSVLGFEVMGIWADDSDFTDINSVCASKRGRDGFNWQKDNDPAACVVTATEEESADGVPGCGYLVTADDYSTVRLFNYPAVWDDAPYKQFRGHASHVMWIQFNCDDRRVLSAGGADRGIYQWRTLGINRQDADADKLVLACMDHLITERRNKNTSHEPKPGKPGDWVALDESGRVFGPKGLALDKTMERSARLSATGQTHTSAPNTPSTLGRATILKR